MGAQRTEFTLQSAVVITGPISDPTVTIVPSVARVLPKGANGGGAQVAVSAVSFGNAQFRVALQGTNEADPNNPNAADPNASWVAAAAPTTVFSAADKGPRMINPMTQNVTLGPFTFVRATLVLVAGSLFTTQNLTALVHVKLDYQSG